jgi:hypothetical protein
MIDQCFVEDSWVFRGGLDEISVFCFEIMAAVAVIELIPSSIMQQRKG